MNVLEILTNCVMVFNKPILLTPKCINIKSGNLSLPGNSSARKCTRKILPSNFLPSSLYFFSLFVPCAFMCASLTLPVLNHHTMAQKYTLIFIFQLLSFESLTFTAMINWCSDPMNHFDSCLS